MSAEGPTGSAALAVLRLILERGELIAVRLGEPAVAGRHVQRLGHLMSAIEALTGSSQRGPGGLLAAQLPAVAAEPGREQARGGMTRSPGAVFAVKVCGFPRSRGRPAGLASHGSKG
jgi:hypothetical protein